MSMNKSCILLFVIAGFIPAVTFAQQGDVYLTFKEKFPDEPAVFVERSETMNILVEGDSLRIYSDVLEDIIHLKDQSDGYAGSKVYGSHFNQVENIRAKTLLWEKNRYKEMVVSDFKKNSDRSAGIFFDDSYYYSFNFPAIALRNRTQLQYREILKDPHFLSGFVFTSYLPQGKTSFTIKTTKDVDLHYYVTNDPKSTIKFKRTEKGNNVLLEWTATDLPTIKSEENSPAYRYMAPHVICYIKSYSTKTGKFKVLENVGDLYKWYYNFVKDVNIENSSELETLSASLKKSSKDEIDFVKKVFYWVQENIQYIAFEQGMRGFIPHSGSYVCEKRYGDCKDMANLIVNLLKSGGVTAYHTWIGTRDLPYRYSEVPTPLVDNHMIAMYKAANGQVYFLDATSDHTPFGFPSSMIQGKEALVGIAEGKFEVMQVPVVEMDRNVMMDSMTIKLENNMLSGKGKSSLHGFAKVFSGYSLDRAEKDDVKKYVTRLIGKGNNKFYLDQFSVSNFENRDRPTGIDYTFRIADYHQTISDEIYLNLNLSKEYYNAFINMDLRKAPYENEYRYVRYEDISFDIPEGYMVEYLPENFEVDGSDFGCSIAYKQVGNQIIYHKKFFLNYLMLEVSSFQRWNDAVKKFSEAYKEAIILKKK